MYIKSCTLCLLKEIEVDPWLKTLRIPDLGIGIVSSYGMTKITFQSTKPVDHLIEKAKEKFPTFFMEEESIEEAVHKEFISQKKTLGLAESCTGGAIAARLTTIPDASIYFQGSIVAYSNVWKEHFLGVRRDTLKKKGAVSKETVIEMIRGLFDETDADYAMGVSGMLGREDTKVFIAIAKRSDFIDVGKITPPDDRLSGIEFTVKTALGALWRRIAHNTATFS